MFGLGSGEILVIAILALFLFGKEDLPIAMRKIMKGISDFRKVANDAQSSWVEMRDDVTRSLMKEEDEIQRQLELGSAALHKGQQEPATASLEEQKVTEEGKSEVTPSESESLQLPLIRPVQDGIVARGDLVEPAETSAPQQPDLADTAKEGNKVDNDHHHHEERGEESQTPTPRSDDIQKHS
jgi:Sec-independent protein translocase protein TatA